MKIKVNTATEIQLDWLVAKCESLRLGTDPFGLAPIIAAPVFVRNYKPSTDWSVGGPIIERELIRVIAPTIKGVDWVARIKQSLPANMNGWFENVGPTPLIAAMRCYVTSKLGDEVEIPDELSTGD